MSTSFAEIARHPARFGAILALGIAVAMLALFLARLDTQAVHTDGLLEMDGNVAFDGGDGVDPGTTPCPYPSTTPRPDPVDCIGTVGPLAAFDWADDPATGDQEKGLCIRGAGGLIDEASTLPSVTGASLDDVICNFDHVVDSTADTSYHSGSDKDYQEIWDGSTADWGCVDLSQATNKADLLNAGFVLATDDGADNTLGTSDDHQLFYAFAERDSEHGDVFDGFWIVQDQVNSDCPPSTGGDFCFDPSLSVGVVDSNCDSPKEPSVHTCGDVLILFNYESGGSVGTSAALQWQPDLDGDGNGLEGCDGTTTADDCTQPEGPGIASHDPLCLITVAGNDCRSNAGADDFCGRVNAETTCQPVPKAGCNGLELGPGCFTTLWEPNDGSCPAGGVAPPTFAETGIDLTAFGIEIPCVGAFLAESRSSSSVDATLKDFTVAPTGVTCTSSIETDIHAGSNAAVEPPPHTVLTDCTPAPCGATGTVVAGTTVHDAAFLALGGPGGTAGGTVTFTRFANINCSGDGTAAGTRTVSQAIGSTQRYESDDFTPLAGATAVSYKASYSGDASKQIPASTSVCEPLNVINPDLALDKDAAPVASVTYTYQLKNSGDVDLTSPSVTDDKCSPAQVLSGGFNTGDTNTNGEFDPTETWNFACTTPIALTSGVALTNTATGTANDPLNNTLTKLDVVITTATLVVNDANGE